MIKQAISTIILKLIPFWVLPIAIFSVQQWAGISLGSTAIWWAVQLSIIATFTLGWIFHFDSANRKVLTAVTLYLVWNIIGIIRGFYVAESYWDTKGLISNSFALTFPVVIYLATNKEILLSILSFFIKITLPFAFLIFPFIPSGAWGWYLFPISLIIIFFPLLKSPWKIITLAISLIAILGDLSTRSHAIKFGIPILIIVVYYLRSFWLTTRNLEIIRKIFMFLPWIFFILAVSGIFNVFNISSYIKSDYKANTVDSDGTVVQQSITQDSRTFLYKEVLESALKYNYWFIGRTPARGNETKSFASVAEAITGRKERLRNEAAILNVFTWTGIVGIILFFIIYYQASYLAIKKSNNIFIKLIGLFVSFRWMYTWIEDFNALNMNWLVIYSMIGLCFSKSFREMNNFEVKLWVRAIFTRKYHKIYKVFNQRSLSRLKILKHGQK